MIRIERTKDRVGYADYWWKKGYTFITVDYNFNPEVGQTYVSEVLLDGSFRNHDVESVRIVT